MPSNPRSLGKIKAAYSTANPDADCPTGAAYAERREACGIVEYFEFFGPPSGSYYDANTGVLLGIDYSVEGMCTYAGQIGFGCADAVKCTFLCGTGKGRLIQPMCEPVRDGGADASDAAPSDGGTE
jgi:hypothetical protein